MLEFIKRNDLQIEVWKIPGEVDLPDNDSNARYDAAAQQIQPLANIFNDLGCTFGLYNHGGWGGLPTTMVEIARRLENVGIVYNFHHGHEHLPSMSEDLAAMLPHLLCVNLNGMAANGPQILPLADGEDDASILRLVAESGYKGPIGILDHRPETDAEESLKQNLAGMQKLLRQLDAPHVLSSYL